jgi:hypothetical protein
VWRPFHSRSPCVACSVAGTGRRPVPLPASFR